MNEKLSKYNQKRDFQKTSEPMGEIDNSTEGLSFVVQHHIARRNHYDLRLEWKGVLLSWAIPKGPSYITKERRLAVKVEDHPLDYRNFEGTIPPGEYGGGTVMVWDEGSWQPQKGWDVDKGLEKGELKFILKGRRLKGKWALIRWNAKSGQGRDNWLLLKERDEFVKEEYEISEYATSIKTGRTMEEIAAGESEKTITNPFANAQVQLAKAVKEIPQGDNWVYELKYDGYRIISYLEGSTARLVTRNGIDYTDRYKIIADSLLDLSNGRAMVLDGELAVTDDDGKTDFQALQNYRRESGNLTYIIFDILALDGMDIRQKPLSYRKELLGQLLENPPPGLFYSGHIIGKGEESFKAACQTGMEGIIGKKIDSVYSVTKNGDWVKLKCDKRQEFIIGGYTVSEKRSFGISSLLLGVYEAGELIYVGRAGTGINEAQMKILLEKFETTPSTPFKNADIKQRPKERITWLVPKLVAEIKYSEWTADNLLMHASYKGLREDKIPADVVRERAYDMEEITRIQGLAERLNDVNKSVGAVVIEGVKISNPDKVIFDAPLITKADVVRYYLDVSSRMLPFVEKRVLSEVRCHKGISEPCFFKKHPGPGSKGVTTIQVQNSEGKIKNYFYIEGLYGLIHEAQMGTLEFHTWGSSIETLENPDIMVFDLDPDEGMDLERVRLGVEDLRSILSELSLHSYLKTSGGKGYHILVPLKPFAPYEAIHGFSRQIAEVMEKKWPDRYTSNIRKASRKGRIFIDWIRNGRGATSVAPYSLRARQGAPVSMPISWEELYTVAPNGIDIKEALKRITEEDPWKDFFTIEQMIGK